MDNMELLKAMKEMMAEMEADQNANLDQIKREIMDSNMKNNQEVLAKMETRIEENMKAEIHSVRSEFEETITEINAEQ
jgi:hypothetical protein